MFKSPTNILLIVTITIALGTVSYVKTESDAIKENVNSRILAVAESSSFVTCVSILQQLIPFMPQEIVIGNCKELATQYRAEYARESGIQDTK